MPRGVRDSPRTHAFRGAHRRGTRVWQRAGYHTRVCVHPHAPRRQRRNAQRKAETPHASMRSLGSRRLLHRSDPIPLRRWRRSGRRISRSRRSSGCSGCVRRRRRGGRRRGSGGGGSERSGQLPGCCVGGGVEVIGTRIRIVERLRGRLRMRHVSAGRCTQMHATKRNKSSHEKRTKTCLPCRGVAGCAGRPGVRAARSARRVPILHTRTHTRTHHHVSARKAHSPHTTHTHSVSAAQRSISHLARAICAACAARCGSRELFALRSDPVSSDARHHRVIGLRIPLRLLQRPRLTRPLGAPVHRAVGAVRGLVALLAADVAAVDGGACAEREGRRQLMWCARVCVREHASCAHSAHSVRVRQRVCVAACA
jgi:hypothetical protein